MVFEAGFWVFLVSRKANLSVELGKCQLLRFGGPTSPFEHHIHQQESDWLQGSGSPFTTSDTTIPCPHPPTPTFSPLCNPFFPNWRASFLLSSSRFSPYLYICFLSIFHSLSGLLLFFLPQAPSLFSTLPPTGWAVKQERAHGRPLTSRNWASELCRRNQTTADFFKQSLNQDAAVLNKCSVFTMHIHFNDRLSMWFDNNIIETKY